MSARLTILLTVALAMILNVHIVVARSLPSEMLRDFEGEQLAKKLVSQYKHYIDEKYQSYVKQIEQSLPSSVYIENYDKPVENTNEVNNHLNDKSVEESPEPLPNPAALVNDDKEMVYKKSGSNYHMTICHFKICNMGRKRDTHNQMY